MRKEDQMIDMEVRWSDGWKAGNVLQIYEKAVVIFAVGFFLFLQLIIWGIEELTDSTLRSLPHIFLMWFGILSSLLLIWELSKSFFAWGRKRGMRLLSVIKKIWYGFVVVIGIVVILIGLFISIFTYTPEHIVVQNGVRMVASVNSFLQEQVYYYEYKNLIFQGSEELGYENYGNGGRDPLEDENRDPRYKHFKE